MLETGKILQERYRVEKQIGQGGMGSVYLATDKRFNSTVAIKETLFNDDNFRRAFSREARLLNSLKHTALPKVSDTSIEENGQYIVMEYIAGDNLFEMLEKSGEAFPKKDVLIWAEQLLDALDYLHGQENPIIHRDIKPQNLKITPEGQIILLDFGLAKGNPTDANHQTAANSIFGYSRNYASLEQIQGTGTDPRSDIYSLAATLYHLATGKPPADALTRVMMVLNEENDPLLPAHLVHEQIPEDLSKGLTEAMSLNANLRPQSAKEMRELLSGKKKVTVSTKPNTDSVNAAETNLYTQNTKVFAEGEKPQENSKQSDIETEILDGDVIAGGSVKANIAKPITQNGKSKDRRSSPIVTRSNPSRSRLLSAAGVGIFLLVGSFASMVYVFGLESSQRGKPTASFSQSDRRGNLANLEDAELTRGDKPKAENLASGDTLAQGESFLESLKEKTDVVSKTDSQTQAIATKKETVRSAERNSKASVGEGKLVIKNGLGVAEGVVNKNGTVETDEAFIDENGKVTLKTPRSIAKPKGNSRLPAFLGYLETLTPEQRKKVLDEFKKQKRIAAQKRFERDKQRRLQRDKQRRLEGERPRGERSKKMDRRYPRPPKSKPPRP